MNPKSGEKKLTNMHTFAMHKLVASTVNTMKKKKKKKKKIQKMTENNDRKDRLVFSLSCWWCFFMIMIIICIYYHLMISKVQVGIQNVNIVTAQSLSHIIDLNYSGEKKKIVITLCWAR